MTVVLDAGALIALERNDRTMGAAVLSQASGTVLISNGAVVGQVWRGGARQARLARASTSIDVRPLDESLGRAAGRLLGLTRSADVVDAAVVAMARDGDVVVTSDVGDLRRPAEAAGLEIDLVPT